ncbi:MAG: hypothetical protein QY325_09735 [Flavobacteriales bacterium]|nr:MAG: hypothetical protein QY325_09735 [Flavobacteriales bacterium]
MRTAPNHPITFGNALVCILVLALPALTRGQLRNANWLLSNYWISFANGAPENLPPSPTTSAAACLSDTLGNLLVYFTASGSGVGIWSADHVPVAGNPSFDGHFTAVQQSTIFVPKPGDPERAYLIAWNRIPLAETHRFGLLEIFLGNATDPPQVLSTEYTWFMEGAACKRMVVPHANGEDYWFIAQMAGANEYHAYLITSLGLSTTLVISNAGALVPLNFGNGKLIPTVEGTRFVSVSETSGYTGEPVIVPSIVEIHSFDPSTGIIQHQHTLDITTRADGVEFSPSGRYLYGVHWSISSDQTQSYHALYQYDLEASDPNLSPLLMDSYVIGGLSGYSTNILCHAPDGRIYMSRYTQSMGVISAPNLPYPQCDYVHDGYLAANPPPSLPSFIKRYNDPPPLGPMGISGRTAPAAATVLPNPLSGHGELRWPGASGAVALQWMDAQGRLVRSEARTVQGDRVALDAGGLAAGQYLLRAMPRDEAPVVLRVSVEE